jgi:hypothetical protein
MGALSWSWSDLYFFLRINNLPAHAFLLRGWVGGREGARALKKEKKGKKTKCVVK